MKILLELCLSYYIWCLCCCHAQNMQTYFVTPNGSATCPNNPCHTLSTYVSNPSYYFRSSSTFIFLSGVHLLDRDVIFKDVINLTLEGSLDSPLQYHNISSNSHLYGINSYDTNSANSTISYSESSAQIQCVASSGIAFINVTNLNIYKLSILNCGSMFNSVDTTKSSVLLWNITNCVMDKILVQNGTGFGIRAIDVIGYVKIVRSSFIGNNQIVKDTMLNKKLQLVLGQGQVTMYNNTNFESTFSGGNAYFLYTNQFNIHRRQTTSHLVMSNNLFVLGVDGTKFKGRYSASVVCSPAMYTAGGLTIKALPSAIVSVTISDTILYRNQGGCGANIVIRLNRIPNEAALTYTNVSSIEGVGLYSGDSFNVDTMSSIANFSNILISNSTFGSTKVEFKGEHISVYGSHFIYTDTYSRVLTTFVNCQFKDGNYSSSLSTCMHCEFSHTLYKGDNSLCFGCKFRESAQCRITNSIAQKVNLTNSTYSGTNSTCYECQFTNSSYYQNYGLCNFCHFTYANFITLFNGSSINSVYLYTTNYLTNMEFFNYSGCSFVHSPSLLSSNGIVMYHSCSFLNSSMSVFLSQISFFGRNIFANSSFQTSGGAICLRLSTIVFEEGASVNFTNNTAINGGAIYMDSTSNIRLNPSKTITVSFLYNRALLFGGAIYADNSQATKAQCFFKTSKDKLLANNYSAIAYFEGNTAREAGSVLYGGSTICIVQNPYFYSKIYDVKNYVMVGMSTLDNATTSSFVSDPVRVLQCNCNNTSFLECPMAMNKTLYPGEVIQVSLFTVDRYNVVVPGVVFILDTTVGVTFISTLRTSLTCNVYTISLSAQYYASRIEGEHLTTLSFSTQKSFPGIQESFAIYVQSAMCPIGFVQVLRPSPSCVCEPLLTRHGVSCDIDDETFTKNDNIWIGSLSNNSTNFGVAHRCPYNYCKNELKIKALDLNSQCAYNRINILCGQCKGGLSMMFGTSECSQCSDLYLLLVIPFAVMGLALVGVLFFLNMTVSSGTLSGLIFYANIVRINDSIFFPAYKSTSYFSTAYLRFMSTFIAWLNLDFGIETCFFNGMDSYAKTWLQFAFPTYVFGLVGVVILAGRYCSKISNLKCFSNAVPVLATLILLCFSKFLRTMITIFSFCSIDADSNVYLVWSYDGNITYLELKHAVIFIFGIVVTICIVPYTTILLLVPCLQSRTNWRWVDKMKPLLDCHAGPYKDRYRYWSGVLLAVRFPLYVLFSAFDSINVRLLGIVIAVVLYMMLLCSLSVYRKVPHLVLEIFIHLNLLTITISYLFDPVSMPSLPVYVIVQVGIGCTFICFVAVVIVHVAMVLRRKICCEKQDSIVMNKASPTKSLLGMSTINLDAEIREPLIYEAFFTE